MRILLALALGLACVPALAASDAVAELQGFYQRLRDMETRFEQTQYDESGVVMQVTLGRFSLARPDRFRWEYVTPYMQTMVSDGKTFWFYDVDLAQATRRKAEAALQGAPALLLSGGPALTEQFNLSSQGQKDGLSWVRLLPNSKEGDFREIRLGIGSGLPQVMELHDNLGQSTRIRFHDIRLNPGLKPGHFAFKPPAGTEVVDGDAIAPPAR